uniref:Uncharacterized protein n=1 Tax=Bracon brevicornis TaxID=1563983 RepID=A0A6V7LSD1_9HYME
MEGEQEHRPEQEPAAGPQEERPEQEPRAGPQEENSQGNYLLRPKWDPLTNTVDKYYCFHGKYVFIYGSYFCGSCAENFCTYSPSVKRFSTHLICTVPFDSHRTCAQCRHPLQFIRRSKFCSGCKLFCERHHIWLEWNPDPIEIPSYIEEEVMREAHQPMTFEGKLVINKSCNDCGECDRQYIHIK